MRRAQGTGGTSNRDLPVHRTRRGEAGEAAEAGLWRQGGRGWTGPNDARPSVVEGLAVGPAARGWTPSGRRERDRGRRGPGPDGETRSVEPPRTGQLHEDERGDCHPFLVDRGAALCAGVASLRGPRGGRCETLAIQVDQDVFDAGDLPPLTPLLLRGLFHCAMPRATAVSPGSEVRRRRVAASLERSLPEASQPLIVSPESKSGRAYAATSARP